MKNIFVVSLALYQTKFWNKVINDINLNDYKVKIIILDTESKNYLRKKNRSFIDASNILKNNKFFTISDIKKKTERGKNK